MKLKMNILVEVDDSMTDDELKTYIDSLKRQVKQGNITLKSYTEKYSMGKVVDIEISKQPIQSEYLIAVDVAEHPVDYSTFIVFKKSEGRFEVIEIYTQSTITKSRKQRFDELLENRIRSYKAKVLKERL